MTPEQRRWIERAERDADRVAIEDVMRLAAMTSLNPPEREVCFTRLSDGELAFLASVLHRHDELFAWGIQTGRIQTDPPGGQIVLTAKVLAEIGTLRHEVGSELAHRLGL